MGDVQQNLVTQVTNIYIADMRNGISGIETAMNSTKCLLSPNPANDVLNMTISDNAGKIYYSIYNLIGSKIAEGVFVGGLSHIDVSNYPNGMYFLKLSEGKIESAQKFLVEKK
jgi:hypothetical protein